MKVTTNCRVFTFERSVESTISPAVDKQAMGGTTEHATDLIGHADSPCKLKNYATPGPGTAGICENGTDDPMKLLPPFDQAEARRHLQKIFVDVAEWDPQLKEFRCASVALNARQAQRLMVELALAIDGVGEPY